MQEHILPIPLEWDAFDKELLAAPEMLRELVENYKRKKLNFDKQHKKIESRGRFWKETSIFNHLVSNILIFVMALISLIVAIIVIMLLFKGAKMCVDNKFCNAKNCEVLCKAVFTVVPNSYLFLYMKCLQGCTIILSMHWAYIVPLLIFRFLFFAC